MSRLALTHNLRRLAPVCVGLAVALSGLDAQAADPFFDEDDDEEIVIEGDDDDDDDLIIIDEDESEVAADGTITISDDDDEDEIIIIEEDETQPELPKISGALGRLWEALFISVNAETQLHGQWTSIDDGPLRFLGRAGFESWLIPAQNLSLYGRGFARIGFDAAPSSFRIVPIIDIYEAYAKINAQVGSVQLGRLVVPWGKTRVASLGDRLNPPDHRRFVSAFPDAADLRQPQWGAQVQTSLGSVILEGVLFTLYEPTEGSLAASNQGGVRTARYQTSLVRNPIKSRGVFKDDDRTSLYATPSLADATTIGVRARRRVGELKLSGSVVTGPDEVPTLGFNSDVARSLGTIARGLPGASSPCPPLPQSTDADCIGARTLSHTRTASLAADVEWGFGLVTLKGEAIASPKIAMLPGKTAVLVDNTDGMVTQQVSQYGWAVAAETGYGDWFEGSLELFDVMWLGLPRSATLWGVELLRDPIGVNELLRGFGMVHRLAVGAQVAGSLFDQALRWRLRGEGGVLQADVLVSGELRYDLPILNLYVGSRGNLFTGLAGSPGWMRQDASLLGIFMGWASS